MNNTLKELRVFASVGGRFVKEEFVQADGGSAEGIGLEDIGAGLEIFLVDAFDGFGTREEEQFVRRP